MDALSNLNYKVNSGAQQKLLPGAPGFLAGRSAVYFGTNPDLENTLNGFSAKGIKKGTQNTKTNSLFADCKGIDGSYYIRTIDKIQNYLQLQSKIKC